MFKFKPVSCVQLILVRKFLEMEEHDVLTIYDETRKGGKPKKKVQLKPMDHNKAQAVDAVTNDDAPEIVDLKYD